MLTQLERDDPCFAAELALLCAPAGLRGDALADAISDHLRDAGHPTSVIDSPPRMLADPAHIPAHAQLAMVGSRYHDVSHAAEGIAHGVMTG